MGERKMSKEEALEALKEIEQTADADDYYGLQEQIEIIRKYLEMEQ